MMKYLLGGLGVVLTLALATMIGTPAAHAGTPTAEECSKNGALTGCPCFALFRMVKTDAANGLDPKTSDQYQQDISNYTQCMLPSTGANAANDALPVLEANAECIANAENCGCRSALNLASSHANVRAWLSGHAKECNGESPAEHNPVTDNASKS